MFKHVIIVIFIIFSFFGYGNTKDISVSIKVLEITDVNLAEQSFRGVIEVSYSWNEKELAGYIVDKGYVQDENYVALSYQQMNDIFSEKNIKRPFTAISNIQDKITYQNRAGSINRNGDIIFIDRLTSVFRIAETSFHKFPFDKQTLYVDVESLLPISDLKLIADTKNSGVDKHIDISGWSYIKYRTESLTSSTSNMFERSKVRLSLDVQRFITYYIIRIFLPFSVLLAISWFTSFLNDYKKRADISSSNMVAFIALNLLISRELPSLNYLTFMDIIIIFVFLLMAVSTLINMFLEITEQKGDRETIIAINKHFQILFLLTYAVLLAVVLINMIS